MKKIKNGLVVLFLMSAINLLAQKDTALIQFSGVVLRSDSLYPIVYTYVYEKRSRYGDITDVNGFFSLAAKRGDTIVFNALEFKKNYYIIPDTLTSDKYNIIKLLTQDTNYLEPVIIYPLPPRVQFDYIFVKTEIPDDDLERARKNLDRESLRQDALRGKVDAQSAYTAQMRQQANNLYFKGQLPPNPLLNPLSWAKFFESWQRGDYKKKRK